MSITLLSLLAITALLFAAVGAIVAGLLLRQTGSRKSTLTGTGGPEESGEKPSKAIGVMRNTPSFHPEQEASAEALRLQTVGTMAGGIAHEFNNHLTPIRGFIELALDYLGEDHPVSDGLETAMNRVEYCTELVGHIQAYGGKSLPKKEPLDLDRLLSTTVRVALATQPEAADRITLKNEWTPPLPRILGDCGQIQQAIVHLIINAIEAMPGGGQLTIKVGNTDEKKNDRGPSGSNTGDYIELQVIDTGIGIRPENLDPILDPFFTTNKSPSARGMGLPMVQSMVARHDGWMEIRTEPDKGTAVHMFLPVLHEKEKRETAEADEDGTMAVLPAADLGKMLVVDDEEHIRRLIERVFMDEGWNIDTADDYNEVLTKIVRDGRVYDLIVLDVTMPGPTAEESIRQITEALPEAKILFVSGYAKDEHIEKLLKLANVEFLSKPFSPKVLLTTVDAFLSQTT